MTENKSSFDNLIQSLLDGLPSDLSGSSEAIRDKIKTILSQQLAQLDLVTREEFDTQVAVLQKTRAKLEALEAQFKT